MKDTFETILLIILLAIFIGCVGYCGRLRVQLEGKGIIIKDLQEQLTNCQSSVQTSYPVGSLDKAVLE